ncbi:GbsR/MarR family transcriptional regulator [Aeromicrobium sp. CTD01-1L150]|uniref:GbsR/MarR family transcriptional regulator n=1 Tax=Aeromicrobium sp. CTD01-1L150 TaxID=3341830 RepID=UPI0035C08496
MSPAQAEFVETLALQLSEAGMQRMAARVFTALMIAPGGGWSAREIGQELSVSAGAVSGATRTLVQVGLVRRRRVPGERSDRFEVRGTAWAESLLVRSELIKTFSTLLQHGIAATEDPDALRRLRETDDFFAFLVVELPKLVDKWHEVRDSSV